MVSATKTFVANTDSEEGTAPAASLAQGLSAQGLSVPGLPAPGVERRAFRRAPMDRPVMLETRSKTATARSVDVSGGGIALRTDLPLACGERIGVYFELPIRYAIEGQAEVVRREGDLVVLRFVEVAREAVLAMRSFCRFSGLMPAAAAPPSSQRAVAGR